MFGVRMKIFTMKKILTFLSAAAFLLCVSSCEKGDGPTPSVDSTLNGTWELRSRSSAMLAQVDVPPGSGNTIRFSGTRYAVYENHQLKKKGTYTIEYDGTVSESVCLVMQPDFFNRRIVYDGDRNAAKTFIDLRNGRLAFISGCYAYDAGHASDYVKISSSGVE